MIRQRFLKLALPLTVLVLMLVLGLSLGGTVAAADDGSHFTIGPTTNASYYLLDAQPGQTIQRTLRVQNTGNAAGTARLFPVDAVTAQAGGVVYPDEARARNDVGAWAALDTQDVTLAPGATKEIALTITIPAAPRPGQHVGGIVAADVAVQMGTQAGGVIVNTKSRTVTPIVLNLPGQAVEKMAVTEITGGGRAGEQLLLIGLRNDGTAMVSPTGTLVVTNAKGEELQNLPLKLDKIVPNTAIQYPVAVQTAALDAGNYQAKIALTYGQGGTTNDRLSFTITPAQIEQVFPSTKPQAAGATRAVAPTLVAPGSRAGNTAAGNPTTGIPDALATTPIPSSLLLTGIIGGGLLLLTVLGGGVLLGRRKRST